MASITVKILENDGTYSQTSFIKWLSFPHWVRQPIQIYHQVPGTSSGGITHSRGVDNATTALKGMTLRNASGLAEFERFPGARLEVSDGLSTVRCIVTNVSQGSRSDDMTWEEFTLTLREVSE